MTPKELLDTILGYLGFVTEIDEQRSEAGNLTLQIYTEEANRIIGRDGETLEAIQFLLNRVIQSKDREAENIKGGGGAPGGVVNNRGESQVRHIGEEIPQ